MTEGRPFTDEELARLRPWTAYVTAMDSRRLLATLDAERARREAAEAVLASCVEENGRLRAALTFVVEELTCAACPTTGHALRARGMAKRALINPAPVAGEA